MLVGVVISLQIWGASAATARVRPGQSEVVRVPTMGMFDPAMLQTPVLKNCPHLRKNLVPFPTGTADVVIPSGSSSLLRASDLQQQQQQQQVNYRRITVSPNATLIFNDEPMTLHVEEIFVARGGALLLGSETCRLASAIQIVYHGAANSSSLENDYSPGGKTSKGLVSFGGHVEMHGQLFHPTWTRLAATAAAGDTVIHLQDWVNWQVGQQILLTTTIFQDCPDKFLKNSAWCSQKLVKHQNEQRTIVAVSMSSNESSWAVHIDQPLTWMHYAGTEYQGEIALLSRSITVSGTDTGDNFGCHQQFIGPDSLVRVSGVRAHNCGQLNIMGRYPFHFHLMGDSNLTSASYFTRNSVTNSNFRCYVIHGTNATTVTFNTAFNASGMCYYFEDAVEERTNCSYNLAAHVHPILRPAVSILNFSPQTSEIFYASATLAGPFDVSASGFYLPNAYNTLVGNAASGGWSGYAFPNTPLPLGQFRGTLKPDSPYCPWSRPILRFEGNSAHSCGFYGQNGACIYVGAWLGYAGTANYPGNASTPNTVLTYQTGRVSRMTLVPPGTRYNGDQYSDKSGSELVVGSLLFSQIKVFLGNIGLFDWGWAIEIDGGEFTDVVKSAQMFTQAALGNSLVNARSNNPSGALRNAYRQGFQFYDTSVQTIVANTIFRNFGSQCAVSYLSFSDHYMAQGINSVTNLTFQSTDRSSRMCISNCGPECGPGPVSHGSKIVSVWDWDGSVLAGDLAGSGVNGVATTTNASAKTGPTLIGSNHDWWNVDDSCSKDTAYTKLWSCPWTMRQDGIFNAAAPAVDRNIVWIALTIPGILDDVCDSTLYPTCTDQFAPYTTFKMCQWGKSNNTSCIGMGPWRGTSGISSIGWYFRPQAAGYGIDGAPSYFSWDGYQMSRGTFIVLAVAYPPQTTFQVQYGRYRVWKSGAPPDTWFNVSMAARIDDVLSTETEALYAPDKMACPQADALKSYCTNTGARGFGWWFDGSYLLIRIVPVDCYAAQDRFNCLAKYYTQHGVKVWQQRQSAFRVLAHCAGCPVQSQRAGVTYYDVKDEPPRNFLDGRTLHPTLSPTSAPPSAQPTAASTSAPTTRRPSPQPSKAAAPTPAPTVVPTSAPTVVKTTNLEQLQTVRGLQQQQPASASPSPAPTAAPTPPKPSSQAPTPGPTFPPPTATPTPLPSSKPSARPTPGPTLRPSAMPSPQPTFQSNAWVGLGSVYGPLLTVAASARSGHIYVSKQYTPLLATSNTNGSRWFATPTAAALGGKGSSALNATTWGGEGTASSCPWQRVVSSDDGRYVTVAAWGKGIYSSSDYAASFASSLAQW